MFGDRIALVAAAGEHDGRPEGIHLAQMRLPIARNRAGKNRSEFRIEPDLGIESVNQPANALLGYNVALRSTGNHVSFTRLDSASLRRSSRVSSKRLVTSRRIAAVPAGRLCAS